MAKGRKKVIIKEDGLGNVIESVTKATGIKRAVEIFMEGKDCGCDKRKETLNKLFPVRTKVNCFTEKQYNDWKEFREVRSVRRLIKDEVFDLEIKFICELYADIFSKPVYYPCRNCSPKPLMAMIDRLDLVYDSYQLN